MMTIETVKKYVHENIDLLGLVYEINSWDGSLDDLRVYDNDEEFFQIFFENNLMEVARSIYYGNYKYMDEYVTFNGYGNLVSYNEYEVEEMLKSNFDEIFEALLNTWENLCLDDELKEMLEELEEE